MEPFSPNQEFEVKIERMSFGPRAVARIQQPDSERPLVVFVENAAPGDLARIRLTKQHKNYWEAEIVTILQPSEQRSEPLCKHFGECGGCQWQHLKYPAQLAAKKEILLHQLEKTLRASQQLTLAFLEACLQVYPSPDPWNYRTRAQVRGQATAMGYALGFFARYSRRLVAIDHCNILHPQLRSQWQEFRQNKLKEYADSGKDLKIEWTLFENGQISEAINQPHAAAGFTQVNPAANAILRTIVKNAALSANSKNLLWDLYGGNGNLVQELSSEFKALITVDSQNEGIKPDFSQVPASRHAIFKSEVAPFLKAWKKAGAAQKPDCIIVDPPREGLEGCAEVLSEIGAETLILVACDPASLARDLLPILKNYELKNLHLLDMFPQTYHIETVAHLSLKKTN